MEQDKSDGLDRMGPIKPALALCVFAVFVLVYFSLWKGVRSAGKVRRIVFKQLLSNLVYVHIYVTDHSTKTFACSFYSSKLN